MKQETRIGTGIWTLATALILMAGAVATADVCGDLNGDGAVDSSDLGMLLADFGCTGGGCLADVDGDGDTDQQDLAWLITYSGCGYGFDCGPCEPIGSGTIEVDLTRVDNTSVRLADDDYAPDFDGGVTHFTFDFVVTVAADNDWTSQGSHVALMRPDVAFFNHVWGYDGEPNSALFAAAPALEFDTFYSSPPELFDEYRSSFAEGPYWTDTSVGALWWDRNRDEDYAAATTQRFTLIVPEGVVPAVHPNDCQFPLLARVSTNATAASTGADLHHYEFCIVDLAHSMCPGDADGDGDIDQADLGILLGTYERELGDPLYDTRADFDCDGDVDQSDLGVLLAVYGTDC